MDRVKIFEKMKGGKEATDWLNPLHPFNLSEIILKWFCFCFLQCEVRESFALLDLKGS